MSGGLDAKALELPKRFFGAARQLEESGSLTIIATALIDTGSRMDEVIAQEFKGTGNMEVLLDRRLAERRIFPAIDIAKSGTRKEDLLLDPASLKVAHLLRRRCAELTTVEATKMLLTFFEKIPSNEALVAELSGE
jgi:transcription termination factor Rho